MITCCKDCTKRHRACWDTCQEYKAEKAVDWDRKQARQKEEAVRYSLDCARIKAIKKIMKEGRRHK